MGGDINYSMRDAWAWEVRTRPNVLSDFLSHHLDSCKIIDLQPIRLNTTWRNKRVEEARVGKRIDRFLGFQELVQKFGFMHQWVGIGRESNISIILLEIKGKSQKSSLSCRIFFWKSRGNPEWKTTTLSCKRSLKMN